MANNALTQQALAQDSQFRQRIKSILATVAWQVQSEDVNIPNHANREKYANQVIRQMDSEVVAVVSSLVMRPNVFSFETTFEYDFEFQAGHVITAAGDLDIQSQLATDWNDLAEAAGFV